jgi:hypothetical protein
MICRVCGSKEVGDFTGELEIHFPGLRDLNKPVVWVFPEIWVCLNCGNAGLSVPENALRVLGRLLHPVRPVGVIAILQDVGAIEAEALIASPDELTDTRAGLHRLMRRLKDAGIIDAERWQEFFGHAD